jgi:hypothetical protein
MRKNQNSDDANAVWGAEAIGEEIDRSAEQVRYLFRKGAFGDAVQKYGHRTLVGDRNRLKQFPRINTDNDAA